MNRDEMVRRAAAVLARFYGAHDEAWPGWAEESRAVFDAILPQVSTVAELEALPDGSVVVSDNGYPFECNSDRLWSDGRAHRPQPIFDQFGPLTVVWQPS